MTKEVFLFRDPRSRMLLEQQERKLSGPKPTDGSKLSFQEKMKLFAQEVRLEELSNICTNWLRQSDTRYNDTIQYNDSIPPSRLVKPLPETKLRYPRHRGRSTKKLIEI